jgi:DNA-binding beta-propeller fold protein YncE
MFSMPHGLHIGPDDHIYCTDVGDHTVRKFSLDGKLVLQIGVPGHPSPRLSNRPFNLCTHTALAPNGDIYVSDGYGNASVHRFAPDGKYLNSWGACGSGPGEFYIPHNIICDDDGWVYVADRENHRIQVFDGKGRYEAQWNNLYRPCALCRRNDGLFFVGELAPAIPTTLDFPNIGARISILHKDGRIAGRLGDLAPGTGVGQFIAPHGIALDGRGDLYVGEVSYAAWRWSFPDIEMPRHLTTVRKLLDYSDCPNSEPSHELKEPYR